jgi:CRISPR-associated protein Csm2
MSEVTAKKIIVDGDVAELVSISEALGSALSRQLTTSQIRTFFGEVRRIQANWPSYHPNLSESDTQKAAWAYRQTILLRPKLAYQVSRGGRTGGIDQLRNVLDPCIEEIQKANTPKEQKLYFDRFVDFFEAILAYHKAAGGN